MEDHKIYTAVLELKLRTDQNDHGFYHILRRSGDLDSSSEEEGYLGRPSDPSSPRIRFGSICKFVSGLAFLGVLAFVFLKWVGPFGMEKGIIPIINWVRSTFTTPVLACILFTTVALFPTIILPSTPSFWVAGMTFGYVYGFLLIMLAVAIGISLPFLIGSLFHHKIQALLERYPKHASILRLAGEGEWVDQFWAVALIRVSPFPYILYNYCAVATNVKYGPYILGSMLGIIPEVLVAIYTGLLIKTLADASDTHHSLSAQEIIVNIVGLSLTVATTIICTMLVNRKLKDSPLEEELLLR